MSETYEIINGQPQNHPNKMVTWAGLDDFLKMLKKEVPKMGLNNTGGSGSYQYLFGSNNTGGPGSYQYLFGNYNTSAKDTTDSEDSGDNVFVIGFNNEILGQSNYIIGDNNHTLHKGNYIFGSQNYLSTYTYVIGDGNGAQEAPTINQNGMILGHCNEIYAKNGQVYALGQYLKTDEQCINTKPLYMFGQYNEILPYSDTAIVIGNGPSDNLSTTRSNLLTIGYDGGINIKSGYLNSSFTFKEDVRFQKGVLFSPSTTLIKDDLKLVNEDNRYVYRLGALRPIFQPWYSKEMLWLVDNNQESLCINYRPQSDIDDNFSSTAWAIPKNISFYAGSETEYASLQCGELTANGQVNCTTLSTGRLAAKIGLWSTEDLYPTIDSNNKYCDFYGDGIYSLTMTETLSGNTYYHQGLFVIPPDQMVVRSSQTFYIDEVPLTSSWETNDDGKRVLRLDLSSGAGDLSNYHFYKVMPLIFFGNDSSNWGVG